MDRRWIAPLVIAGSALALVALFVLLSGGQKPAAPGNDAVVEPDSGGAVEATMPAWMTASPTPTPSPTPSPMPSATPSAAPSPTPSTIPTMTNPLLGDATIVAAPGYDAAGVMTGEQVHDQKEVVALMRLHIAQMEGNIARLEAEGKHDEAEKRRKAVERLKGELDIILDGGT